MRKFTAVPGKGIFAGSKAANKRRIMAAEDEMYEYDGKLFDWRQMNVIKAGLNRGLDVSIYADPKFNEWHMYAILEGLEQGIDPSIYANPEFSYPQMREIREGLVSGVDVNIYADPKYSWDQMAQIRKGLEAGLDVSTYADPNIDAKEMRKTATKLLRQHSGKQGEQNTSSNSKTQLHVEYYPYERYSAGGRLRKANITAPTELEALAKMCNKLGLYMDYDDVMENGSVEAVIDSIDESNGDGCDYITLLENRTTGEVLIESDWGPDEDHEEE